MNTLSFKAPGTGTRGMAGGKALLCAAAVLALAACASSGMPLDDVPTYAPGQRPVPPEVQAPANLSDRDFAAWLKRERERVGAEKEAARQRFEQAELQCWKRFAVNDCIRAARRERRAELDRLRDQELALNQQERQRRTAQRLEGLEQKAAPAGR